MRGKSYMPGKIFLRFKKNQFHFQKIIISPVILCGINNWGIQNVMQDVAELKQARGTQIFNVQPLNIGNDLKASYGYKISIIFLVDFKAD
jgi:hypothetical protein